MDTVERNYMLITSGSYRVKLWKYGKMGKKKLYCTDSF